MAGQGNLGDWTDCSSQRPDTLLVVCDEHEASWAASFSPTFHTARLKPVTPTGRLTPAPIPFPTKPLLPKLLHPQLSCITIPSDQDPSGWANTMKVSSPKAEQAKRKDLGSPGGRRDRGALSSTCWFICWQAGLTTYPSLLRASELSAHILYALSPPPCTPVILLPKSLLPRNHTLPSSTFQMHYRFLPPSHALSFSTDTTQRAELRLTDEDVAGR